MTDAQSNSLDMYLAVTKFYDDNNTIIDLVPARTTAFAQLATNIAAINVNVGGQSATTIGVTQDKAALRTTLDNLAFSILAPSKAWALSEGNNTLAQQFNISLSDLNYIKDDTIGAFCTMRLDLITPEVANMADYGVTQPLLDAWAIAIADYNAVLAFPREAIVNRSQNTKNLKQLFKQTSLLFSESLDPLMVPLKISDPEVYQMYLGSRIIIDRKGKQKGGEAPQPPALGVIIQGLAVSAEDEVAIPEAEVVVSIPGSQILETTTTDANGAFSVTILELPEPGINEVKIQATHQDFETTIVSQMVEAGNAYVVNIDMPPSAP